MTVYRVSVCEPVQGLENTYRVGFAVEHMDKVKFVQTNISSLATTEVGIITEAWAVLKNEIDTWIGRVDVGNYLTGSTFTPQEDGTLVFSSN